MDPYLVEVASNQDALTDSAAINDDMDKLEFLYEAVGEYEQDLIGQLMQRLQQRLEQLG